jgi:hypothetical protein
MELQVEDVKMVYVIKTLILNVSTVYVCVNQGLPDNKEKIVSQVNDKYDSREILEIFVTPIYRLLFHSLVIIYLMRAFDTSIVDTSVVETAKKNEKKVNAVSKNIRIKEYACFSKVE